MPKNEFISQLLHLKEIKRDLDLRQEEENSKVDKTKENEKLREKQEQRKIEEFSKACHQKITPILKMVAQKLSLDNVRIYENSSTGKFFNKETRNLWTGTLQWGRGSFETDPDNDTSYPVYPHITIEILMEDELINPSDSMPKKTYLIKNLSVWEPNFYDENRTLISGVTLFDKDWEEKLGQWIVGKLKSELKIN